MTHPSVSERRSFLRTAASAGLVLADCATAGSGTRSENAGEERGEGEVTPAEDLMHEHGVLRPHAADLAQLTPV